MNRVSVIIPTLNAASTLRALLEKLEQQTLHPCEILVVDSASDDETVAIASSFPLVCVLSIIREEYDHGGTRDWALRQTQGEFICFLTQDALPRDDNYLASLIAPFSDTGIACVCGRQEAHPDALPEEKLTRRFNYPQSSFVRSQEDISLLGIKTYFLSDACSAYRRSTYLTVGGFEQPIITNEDMLMAAVLIHGGYRIAYTADACVLHSHRFSLKQDFRRSFDIGAFLSMHQSKLDNADADSEGVHYVRFVSTELLKKGYLVSFARFGFHCVARFLGSREGKRYLAYSIEQRCRRSSNPSFWKNQESTMIKVDHC